MQENTTPSEPVPVEYFKRALLVAAIVSTGTFVTVYFLNDWFHGSFLPMLNVPNPIGDAIGAVILVLISYFS